MTRFDLHVHSALSACAENVMSPRQILARAQAAGLTMVAVTDHNASGHARVLAELAPEFGVRLVPGMEVTTREEVHVLACFADMAGLLDFQVLVDASLPMEPNVPEVFGHQVLYDAADEIVDLDERLRQVGTRLSLERVVVEIQQRHGVAIPAHLHRYRNSVVSQLGFVDPGAGFDAVEVTAAQWRRQALELGARVDGFPALTGSDAHFLEDIGRVMLELPGDIENVRVLLHHVRELAAT